MKIKNIPFLKKLAGISLMIILWVSAIVFAEVKHDNISVKSIQINQISEYEKPMLAKKDIETVINGNGSLFLIGKPMRDLKLGSIEKRVESIPFVRNCEAHYDLDGTLYCNVKEFTPLARILWSTQLNKAKKDQYITSEGDLLNISDLYTPRVLVVSGNFFNQKIQDFKSKKLFPYVKLFEYISNNEFWKSQIAELIIHRDGSITMIPTIGETKIEFGRPMNIENKFEKLSVFYTRIIPAEGWNKYSTVKLRFKNQIVCE
ncbi:MAG: hypothetical protein RIR51_543 [Bacteroidota bacterium]